MLKRSFACAAAAISLLAACKTTPESEATRNTIRNLEGTNEELSIHIDRLSAEQATLKAENATLKVELEKHSDTEAVVEEAKGQLSESVRQILERFEGDSEIQVERAPGGYRFVLRESVLFDSGSADLTDDGRNALQTVAAALKTGTGAIMVEGHTDNVKVAKPETLKKFPRGNMDLSVERALAVWEYLTTEGGVPASRLGVSGHGSHRPRVPNDSKRNRWRNRRVEIRVDEE